MTRNTLRKGLGLLAMGLGMASAPAMADPNVEVMHFWTTGGEAAALATVMHFPGKLEAGNEVRSR